MIENPEEVSFLADPLEALAVLPTSGAFRQGELVCRGGTTLVRPTREVKCVQQFATLGTNALEAESRRATRFFDFGHTRGAVRIEEQPASPQFPFTLDLRRGKQ